MRGFHLLTEKDLAFVEEALCEAFPGQQFDPKILFDSDGDAIAWFYSGKASGQFENASPETSVVHVDITGRKLNGDGLILAVFAKLQEKLGGRVQDDDGQEVQ